jgi:uncharacterized membrane protein YjdF
METFMPPRKYPAVLLATGMVIWIWSGIGPHDTRLTWVLDMFWCLVGAVIALMLLSRLHDAGLLRIRKEVI